jgi:small subunit ribosomal protein S17
MVMKKTTPETQVNKRTLLGTVVSDKMQKTLVVSVQRFIKDPKYGKYLKVSKKYKAHYEGSDIKVGDKVTMQECRPRSKDKHFEVITK